MDIQVPWGGPDDVPTGILERRFRVVVDDANAPAPQAIPYTLTPGYQAAVLAFSSPAAYDRHCGFSPRTEKLPFSWMDGGALLRELAAADGWDALWIDPNTGPNYETPTPLSPGDVAAVLDGHHPRPEHRVLSARSAAEIDLFLDQMGVFRDGRSRVREAGMDVHTGVVQQSWSKVERTYRFASTDEPGGPESLGPGVSAILCTGYLIEIVHGHADRLGHVDPDDEFDRRTAWAAMLCQEVLAMIPDGQRSIPRYTLRTASGASYASDYPDRVTRQRLTAMHAQLTTFQHNRGTWKRLTRWFR